MLQCEKHGIVRRYKRRTVDTMSILAITYILIISALLVYTGVALIAEMRGNFCVGQHIRRTLDERIKLLRLGRLLKKRQIDKAAYLTDTPLHDLVSQLRQCEACVNTDECDRYLAGKKNYNGDIDFCPNNTFFPSIRS